MTLIRSLSFGHIAEQVLSVDLSVFLELSLFDLHSGLRNVDSFPFTDRIRLYGDGMSPLDVPVTTEVSRVLSFLSSVEIYRRYNLLSSRPRGTWSVLSCKTEGMK